MNFSFIKPNSKLFLRIVCFINFILLLSITLPILYEIKVHSAHLLYIYIAFYIFFPGKLLARILNVGLIENNKSLMFLVYFYFGCALIFAEYYILFFLKAMFLIKYLSLFLTLVELLLIYKYRYNKPLYKLKSLICDYNLTYILLMLVFTFTMCMLANNYKFPLITSIMNPDRPYQISNLVGLTTNQPFQSMTVYGCTFRYHYFNYLFGAICKFIFNIPGYYFINYYMPLYIPFLLVISFNQLFKRVSNNRLLVFFMYIICYFNLLSDRFCYYTLHISSNTNSMGFAIPSFILTILIAWDILVKKYESNNVLFAKHCIVLAVLTFIITGIKGPAGIIFATSYFVYIIFYDFSKKHFLSSIIIFAIFILVYYFIVVGNSQSANSIRFFSNFTFPDSLKSIKNDILLNILRSFFVPYSVVMHYNLFTFPAVIMIPVILSLIFKKRSILVFITILAWCCIIPGFLLKFPGNSELYFLMFAFPLISSIVIIFFNMYSVKTHVYIFLFLMVVAFLPGSIYRIYSATNYNYTEGFFADLSDISNYYLNKDGNVNPIFEGYDYIKNYTDVNSIIATNKLIYRNFEGDYRGNNLAAFGERHVFLEGYQYAGINGGYADLDYSIKCNNLIFSNTTNDEKYNLLKELGINYVFLYKTYVGVFGQDARFVRVFENTDVAIYEII